MKRELKVLYILKATKKPVDIRFQTNTPPHLDKVFLPHAAKLWIMKQQIGKLSALLHEVDFRKTRNSFPKVRDAKHLAQNHSRIVET
jgi:hypothetical protein